ncbi:MAG TPA: hypothetical protein VGP43_01365 [Chitinophagaceae bacterium]|nr:hypothetical protein [Chitinophagaceae bacterium]
MERKKINKQKEKDNPAKANIDLPIKPVSAPEDNASIPVSAEPEIIKQENKSMEVHHHGHVHENKKWKEYFFQFLMLFLAVFCGFLAEYQLEQTIERHKEKDYIKSFTEDLQTDLSQLARVIPSLKENKLGLDSLSYGLHNLQANTADLYYYARQSTRPVSFSANDRTIIQLKNSGGFRLITNKQSADSIMAYQGMLDGYQYFLTREYDEIKNLLSFLSKIFNASVFDTMVDSENRIQKPTGNPPMRSSDPDLINEFSYYIHMRKSTTNAEMKSLLRIQKRAANTLEFLKKKYDLE